MPFGKTEDTFNYDLLPYQGTIEILCQVCLPVLDPTVENARQVAFPHGPDSCLTGNFTPPHCGSKDHVGEGTKLLADNHSTEKLRSVRIILYIL